MIGHLGSLGRLGRLGGVGGASEYVARIIAQGSTLLTNSRGSVAYRFNASGVLEAVSSNSWRWDYDPETLAFVGLYGEPSRTNLMRNSENINTWSVYSTLTITTDAGNAPDGAGSAEMIVAPNDGLKSRMVYISTIGVDPAKRYAQSAFVKSAGLSKAIFSDINQGKRAATYDLATKAAAIVSGAGAIATLKTLSSGWCRCHLYGFAGSVASAVSCSVYPTGAEITSYGTRYVGDGVNGGYLWGGQVEEIPSNGRPTSYIKTPGVSSAARSADSGTLSDLSAVKFDTAKGTLELNLTFQGVAQQNVATFYDAGYSKWIGLYVNGSSHLIASVMDSTEATIDLGAITAETAYKVAISWDSSSLLAVFGGGSVQTQGTVSIPSGISSFVMWYDGAFEGNFWCSKANYYPVKKSSTQLAALVA